MQDHQAAAPAAAHSDLRDSNARAANPGEATDRTTSANDTNPSAPVKPESDLCITGVIQTLTDLPVLVIQGSSHARGWPLWPEARPDDIAVAYRLGDVLRGGWPREAFLYARAPQPGMAQQRRLTMTGQPGEDAIDHVQTIGPIVIQLGFADYDCKAKSRGPDGKARKANADELAAWRPGARKAVERVLRLLPGAIAWESAHGYRIMWVRLTPIVITDRDTRAAAKLQLEAECVWFQNQGLAIDVLTDVDRAMRVPHDTRPGSTAPFNGERMGSEQHLRPLNLPVTQAERDATKAAQRGRTVGTNGPATDREPTTLRTCMQSTPGYYIERVGPGTYRCDCPRKHMHSTDSGPRETHLYESDDGPMGWVHCMHTSCKGSAQEYLSEFKWDDVWQALGLMPLIPPEPEPPPYVPPPPRTDATAPVHALPPAIRDHVLALTETLRTPLGLGVGNGLGAMAAAVNGRVVVQVDAGYAEPATLYVASVLPSGSRKSSALKAAMRPIKRWAKTQRENGRSHVARARVVRAELERSKRRAERQLEGGSDERAAHHTDAIALRERLVTIETELAKPAPAEFEYIVEDVTAEKLTDLLATHGRLACISDDASKTYRVLGGCYSQDGSADLQTWLRAYDAEIPTVHRQSRVTEYRHEHPCLSATLSIQPSVLDEVTSNRAFNGEGLNARFSWVVPEPVGAAWRPGELTQPVPAHILSAYETALWRILAIPENTTVGLTPEALAVYLRWRDEVEARRVGGDLGDELCSWASKHPGRTLRIAGLLWAAERDPGGITCDQMTRAVALGRWLVEHAIKALRGGESSEDESRILKLIGDGITQRDLLRRAPRDYRKAAKLLPVLTDLQARGHIAQLPQGKGWRRAG